MVTPGIDRWVDAIKSEANAVLYDITRIISRRRSRIATGIDQIDLQHARAFLDAYGEDCRFVAKVRKRAVMVDRKLAVSLIEALEKTWFHGGEPDALISLKLDFAGVADGLGAWHRLWHRSRLARYFWLGLVTFISEIMVFRRPALQYVARSLSQTNTAYVVASHAGLPGIRGALATLKSSGVRRFHAYIHDIIPIDYPEYTRPGHAEILENYLAELAGIGAAFVANSGDTAARLTKYVARRGWRLGDVPVVYPEFISVPVRDGAAGNKMPPADRRTPPYFVIVGTIEPRKNHLLLLNIWRDLVQSGQDPVPHLHIVGRRGWENENILDMLDRCAAIRPYVTEHSDLPNHELRPLLEGAQALLMPSFAEGFGLPVTEALQLGVPVIASDLPVFREIAGDSISYRHPLDGEGWQALIVDMARHSRVENRGACCATSARRNKAATNRPELVAEG